MMAYIKEYGIIETIRKIQSLLQICTYPFHNFTREYLRRELLPSLIGSKTPYIYRSGSFICSDRLKTFYMADLYLMTG